MGIVHASFSVLRISSTDFIFYKILLLPKDIIDYIFTDNNVSLIKMRILCILLNIMPPYQG